MNRQMSALHVVPSGSPGSSAFTVTASLLQTDNEGNVAAIDHLQLRIDAGHTEHASLNRLFSYLQGQSESS